MTSNVSLTSWHAETKGCSTIKFNQFLGKIDNDNNLFFFSFFFFFFFLDERKK